MAEVGSTRGRLESDSGAPFNSNDIERFATPQNRAATPQSGWRSWTIYLNVSMIREVIALSLPQNLCLKLIVPGTFFILTSYGWETSFYIKASVLITSDTCGKKKKKKKAKIHRIIQKKIDGLQFSWINYLRAVEVTHQDDVIGTRLQVARLWD